MEIMHFKFVFIYVILVSIIDHSAASVSCSFESGLCGWKSASSGQLDWQIGWGETDDRLSGPLNDHTCANNSGTYAYISGRQARRNDVAILETDVFTIATDTVLSFWYTMNGFGTGKLSLSVLNGNTANTLWEKDGRQGKDWIQGSVDLTPGSWKLQFQSSVRIPYGSDIAIDDIVLSTESQELDQAVCSQIHTTTKPTPTTPPKIITPKPTTPKPTTITVKPTSRITSRRPVVTTQNMDASTTLGALPACPASSDDGIILPGTCDFENDTCGITLSAGNATNDVMWNRTDKIDGFTKDKEHAILFDHTIGNSSGSKGHYMDFMNGKRGFLWVNPPHNFARMETPEIHTSSVCLSFWYSMPRMFGNLKLLVKDRNGREFPIWNMDIVKDTATKGGWNFISMGINEEPPFSIIFHTSNKAFMARVGIDDIKLIGYNTTTTDTTTTIGMTTTKEPSTTELITTTTEPSTTELITTTTHKTPTSSTAKSTSSTKIPSGAPVLISSTNMPTTTDKGNEKKTTKATATKKPETIDKSDENSEKDALQSENKYKDTSIAVGTTVGIVAVIAILITLLTVVFNRFRGTDLRYKHGHLHQNVYKNQKSGSLSHSNEFGIENGHAEKVFDNQYYSMEETICTIEKPISNGHAHQNGNVSSDASNTITRF